MKLMLIQRNKNYPIEFGNLPDSYFFFIDDRLGNPDVRTKVIKDLK